MAFEFQIESGVLICTFKGKVTSDDLLQASTRAGELETQSDVCPNRIIDFSWIDGVNLDFSAVADCAIIRRHAPLKNTVRSAMVAATPLQYAFARMINTLNDNPNITVEIFANRERALAWLATGVRREQF